MSIRFRCYSCIGKIACPEKGMGLYLACPHCGARVRVPIPADLGSFTADQIKANQKAQIKRAKQKARGEGKPAEAPPVPAAEAPAAPPANPAKPADDPPIARPVDAPSLPALDDIPVARPKQPPKVHPVADEPDMLEIEMAGTEDGPNETDDLLASLARVAGDDESEDGIDMVLEHEPVADHLGQTDDHLGVLEQAAGGEADDREAADLLAELAAAAEEDEQSSGDAKDKRDSRGKRGGRRR
ncbi:MAG: hypothetical protein AAGI68_13720 [Planctomycetota bacterium]